MGRGDRRGREPGPSFGEVFGDLADGENLDALREKFAAKAFQRRQEAVLRGLRELGQADAAIVAMDLAALDAVDVRPGEAARQTAALPGSCCWTAVSRCEPDDLAFRTLAGETLTAERLPAYLAELRSVRINMEFNGALCRGLARARYQERRRAQEPTLVDFMLGPVPAPEIW